MFRLGRALSAVSRLLHVGFHQLAHGKGGKLNLLQASLDGRDQRLKGREVAVVGRVALDVPPQVLNRIVIE
jgi:hypothetical protein